MQCSVDGCINYIKTKKSGLCEMHYSRIRRHGSLDKIIPNDMNPDAIFNTKNYGHLKVIEYVNSHRVIVEFIGTNTRTESHASSIRSGSVKDPFMPFVFGVGYIGIGKYKSSENGVISAAKRKWMDMLRRCYDTGSSISNKYYSDCFVCDDWHNFQNFAAWFYEQEDNHLFLDKDILSADNKIYSTETCIFVSNSENIKAAHGKYGKVFTIIKNGEIKSFSNINGYAKENNLSPTSLNKLVNGVLKTHKGWMLNEL